MKKPKLKPHPSYDFNECTAFIEKKYKITTSDYANSNTQFDEWCNEKGYGKKDKTGKKRSESTIWFEQFEMDAKEIKRPYQNFWHWLIDVANPQRGGTMHLDKDMGDGAEPWQQDILGLYLKEFGEGPYLTDW